jgi:hypothetical protein
MDEATLHHFEALWVAEPYPSKQEILTGLTSAEWELYQKLSERRYGYHVRLEQERIPWGHAWANITARLQRPAATHD